MSSRHNPRGRIVNHALLRCASWFVPRQQRTEWLAEWRSELWYVSHSCGPELPGLDLPDLALPDEAIEGDAATAFCLGAFNDALWIRRHTPRLRRSPSDRLESARRCGLALAVLAVASLLTALLLPGARNAILGRHAVHANDTVLISRDDSSDAATSPTISIAEFEAWKTRNQTVFSDFAFYKLIHNQTPASSLRKGSVSLALASDNLFDLLNIPIASPALDEARSAHKPALAISDRAWRSHFGADPDLVGRAIEVAGQQAIVVAILPDASWPLPGRPDLWLMEDNRSLEALPPESTGFVLGRFARAPGAPDPIGWHMSVTHRDDGGSDGFDLTPVFERVEQPTAIFLITLMLACLALPATTPLPLGDYPATDPSLSKATRRRRWLFLMMKIGCTLPIVYFASISLAFSHPTLRPATSEYIQFSSSFLALLFAFRWALRDQRRRCPVCLRLLTNPARVGHPSRNFLAWHGTEFMCDQGHGLLHVPEMATTWFSTQRWLSLDPSWKGLFPQPYLPSAGVF